MNHMYFIGFDLHKKTIICCVKDAAGHVRYSESADSCVVMNHQWFQDVCQAGELIRQALKCL
jgi:hypothetical protein